MLLGQGEAARANWFCFWWLPMAGACQLCRLNGTKRLEGGKDTEIEDIAAKCGPSPGLIYIASHKLYLNGGRSQFVIISHTYSIYTIYYIVYTISGLCSACTLRIISAPATKWPRSQSEWPNGRLPPTDNKFQVCSSNAHSPIAWVDKRAGQGKGVGR